MSEINDKLAELAKLKFDMYQKDFLLTWQKSDEDLQAIVTIAEILKIMHKENISAKVFDTGLAISNFRDKSTRTRLSFTSACAMLGLQVMDIAEEKLQVAHGETVRETANMISFLTQVIGIRDDMFIGKGHTYMLEVIEALDEGYKEGVLDQRPSLINLQCDLDHPTQSMSDLLYLKEYFGGYEKLKGKKLAMTWAYSPSYGKPLSVPQGVINIMPRFGVDVTLAYHKGYDLLPETIETAKKNAEKAGAKFVVTNSMEEAFKDADVVYPKSWASYEVMKKRTDLYAKGDNKGIDELEKECLQENAKHKNWLCDEAKMKLTKNGSALYQHCLPADISGVSCKDGEVTKGVFEKYRIDTYKEAKNKPFIIGAMILCTTFKDTVNVLREINTNSRKYKL